MNKKEVETRLKLKLWAYTQLYQGADDLLQDGAIFWTERLLLRLVRRFSSVRLQQVNAALPAVKERTAESNVQEAMWQTMAEATLGGHDLGNFERVESGWQAKCRQCGHTTWVGDDGLRYGLLDAGCPSQVETPAP